MTIEVATMAKKSVRFTGLLPVINAYQAQGYSYPEIVGFLKDKHDLELTVSTFTNYMFRYSKKEDADKSKSGISHNEVTNTGADPVIEDNGSVNINQSLATDVDDSDVAKTDNMVFGSPEYKAQVNADTEKYFTKPSGISRFKKR